MAASLDPAVLRAEAQRLYARSAWHGAQAAHHVVEELRDWRRGQELERRAMDAAELRRLLPPGAEARAADGEG